MCVGLQPRGVCPSCSGIIALDLQVCPMSASRQDSWAPGRMEGEQWDGGRRDNVNAAFRPESTRRDGFEPDPCICCAGLQGCGTKALGAGTAPACSTGTERAVCCHSPPCDIDACLGCSSMSLPLCLPVCLPPLRGCWQQCPGTAQPCRAVLGEPSMALCRQSLSADSAVAFLGFPGIALSCPGLS